MSLLKGFSIAAVVIAFVKVSATGAPPSRADTEPGIVEPSRRVALYARAGGLVRVIHAQVGDHVKQGQPLVQLALPEVEAEHQEHIAETVLADAQLQQAKLAVTVAETEVRGATAKAAELAVLKADIGTLKAKVAVAQARYAVAKSKALRSEIFLSYGIIRAPFDGVISRQDVEVGDKVLPAANPAAKSVYTIENTDRICVSVEVRERYAAQVHRKTKAVVQLDGFPGQKFAGEVTRFSGVISRLHGTMLTEIELSNPGGKLLPGMRGQVTLTLDDGPNTNPAATPKAGDAR